LLLAEESTMSKQRLHDRRQKYRYEPAPGNAPQFSLLGAGRSVAVERVVDVNLGGARLEISANDGAAFAAGEPVTAVIRAAGLPERTDVRGRVVFRSERGGRSVVAIAFTDVPDPGEPATAAFFSVFNRRSVERAVEGPERVSALLLNDAGEADAVIDLTLLDRSANGIGFSVDAQTDAFIQDNPASAIAFGLPGQDATTAVRVQRREAHGGEVRYGGIVRGGEPAG
jgi:hypothetical protein